MKKLLMFVVLAAAGGGGYYYYNANYGEPVEKPTVNQVPISQGDIVEQIQATGTLEALRTVRVGSQVSGVIKTMNADFNSIVKKDQVLAELDPALLQVDVDIQNANYERQVGSIASAEVQLEDAKAQLARMETTFKKGLSNQQQLDAAVLTVKSRTTALEASKKQLLTSKANLDQAKLNLEYAVIKSPIDGVVVFRWVDVGQTVRSSANVATFFTIATDLRDLKLTAGVDEAEIGKIQPGMPVSFTVDSYPQQVFSGTVNAVRLNATNNNNVVTYPVWIDAPNNDLKLRPSMTATVKILVSTAQNTLRIPNQALRFRPTPDMYTALGLTPPATPARGANPGAARTGGPAPQPTNTNVALASIDGADKIDELFQSTPAKITPGTVWTWDAANKKLTEVKVTTGLGDGSFSQLLSGDLKASQQIVTGIIVPMTTAQRNAANALFGGTTGRATGGMRQGDPNAAAPAAFGTRTGGAGGAARGGGGRGGD